MRMQVGQLDRDPAGHLVQRERLAAPEIAQHQHKPAVVGRYLSEQLVRQVVTHPAARQAQLTEPLRNVQARRIQGVGADPGGLVRHVVAQVEQALELNEAAQPHAAPLSLLAEHPRRLRAFVDKLRAGFGLPGVDQLQERGQLLAARLTGVRGDSPLPDEPVLLMRDQQVRQLAIDSPDLGVLVAGFADLGDPVQQQASGARGTFRPGPRRRALLRFALIGTVRAEGAARRGPSPRQPLRVLAICVPGAPAVQAVRGDPQELVLARSCGAYRNQAGVKLAGLVAAGPRPVQDQTEPRPEQPVERAGVAQQCRRVRPVGRTGRGRYMPDHADPQPAGLFKGGELVSEPCCLGFADPAVVVLGPVAAGHRRIQRGDRQAQIRHSEQAPGLRALEDGTVEPAVQLLEQAGEVTPLGPVRRLRLYIVGLAGGKVRTAGGLGDVVAAGDDHQMLRLQAKERAQPGEECPGPPRTPAGCRFPSGRR